MIRYRQPPTGKRRSLRIVIAISVAMFVVACSNGSKNAAQVGDVEFAPGAMAQGQVEIDGTVIDYFLVVPDNFSPGDSAPVVLALPPGGQGVDLTGSIVMNNYGAEAIDRGWVVVSPAAPGGQLWFQGSEVLIPGFLEWIRSWVAPETDRVHLLGVSNGGISAFRVAAENASLVASIVVYPGFPASEDDFADLDELASIPVRMFVGENDSGWIESMQATQVRLEELGGDTELNVVPDEGHIISTLSDGTRLFDELDANR